MKPFRNSPHPPRWKPPPGCMSCEEIRWWMRELRRRGWTRGAMRRTLSMPRQTWRKANGKEWIYPTEQLRYSEALKRIISGEVVLTQRRRKKDGQHYSFNHGSMVADGALAPGRLVPLSVAHRVVFDRTTWNIRRVPIVPQNPLPSFQRLFVNVPKMAAVKRGEQ